MTSIDEIEAAVSRLPETDRAELLRRLTGRDASGDEGVVDEDGNDDWDRQMIADAKAGKFDALLREVDEDVRAGRVQDFP